MCECGCGDMVPYDVFRIGENIMVVEKYPGCEDCNTGVMVTLNLFSQEQANNIDVDAEKVFKPDEFGFNQLNYPVFGKDDLVIAARQMGADDDFTDWLEESGLELLQRAMKINELSSRSEID